MSRKADRILEQIHISNVDRHGLRQIIFCLSFVVILAVFWNLKLTGIGIAGEAFCGQQEHVHDEQCVAQEVPCDLEEHIHIESCYSNIKADLETYEDWEAIFGDMTRGPTIRENVILVAQSQLGYTESVLNFQVDANGIRRGITRYGQWYGNPYGDWSAMFASFCLHYGGAMGVPRNAGPEAMRLEWDAIEMYAPAEENAPEPGNLVFLNKNENTMGADSVGIIEAADETSVTVIEGDQENTVTQIQYLLEDPVIMGYGIVPQEEPIIMMAAAAPAAVNYTVWLDGTCGGLGYLTGSPNTAYTVQGGSTLQLPDTWTSPSKYSYKLRGWYDVTNARYYPAGAEMVVNGNAVLYADWVASTYDLGVFNAQVADTVGTSSFITTHMFDYNYLFNVQSTNPQVTVRNNTHSETWSMVTSGNVAYNGQETFDFIFTDNDSSGQLNMPNDRSSHNAYHEADTVSSGIYTAELGTVLFSPDNAFDPETGTGILGKTYLGTGDHLLQIMDDPADEHYGYYYYDSKHNAASYNQSAGRFYVYDYLAATSDSIGGAYSDFIPLNSPYANTNGKTVGTFTYDGVDGEYQGTSHYRYDSKYNSGDYNSTNNVSADYAYGMRMDIQFYLPNDPGTNGNKDMYGNDMQFQFSGDDDLWVLIDGKVILDIGGIHQIVSGTIDFSTGEITVNGQPQPSLSDLGIGAGDYTMTVLYLERGSSMSNCAIYFNLAPRFRLELKKEDVLTQMQLDGAQFAVYEDLACTKPAELWESEAAYNADFADGVLNASTNTFTIRDGVARLWGLGSGNTYYIKEITPPDDEEYGLVSGIIRLTIEREGQATYLVDVIPDAEGKQPSHGFTVHGVKIDEETQTVHMTATNAPETVTETTTVQVFKQWEDTKDHSGDYIQAYLTVTDPDGTVRRIREITLSDENNWMYTWTNLPKYDYDALTEVKYGIDESYESGYYSTVRKVTEIVLTKTEWAEAVTFQNGETYILETTRGYLSTQDNRDDTGFKWVDEETAKSSPNALWTVTVSGSNVKFTNGVGQVITLYMGPTDFYARIPSPTSNDKQALGYSSRSGGLQFYYKDGRNYYYIANSMTNGGKFNYTTSANSSQLFHPFKRVSQTDIREVEDWAYQITNTPLEKNNETSVSVHKNWNIPVGADASLYQEFAVTVRLLANGVNTGRTVTLTLKNNWQGSFLGLPYKDADGNVIQYAVEEVWEREKWGVTVGEMKASGTTPPTYSVEITNRYYSGGPQLPSTGSVARLMYILCGSGIMTGSLVYGILLRRKRERRMK